MHEGPSILLNGIGKRFGDGPLVLDDVNLKAEPGEIVAIVGPSGCGKSTLLRIIAGLIQPTYGEMIPSAQPVRPAFIFQDATLLPWATVLDNIALPLRLKGVARQQRQSVAADWARRVGLDHVPGYYPRQLSGGMKMRVSIARAFSTEPNLLLLDEPFGALDAITRNRLNEDLLRLHEEARWTAFFVTHSVTEAAFLCHRLVLLSHHPGRVSAILENPLPFPRNAQTRESLAYQRFLAEAVSRLNACLPDENAS